MPSTAAPTSVHPPFAWRLPVIGNSLPLQDSLFYFEKNLILGKFSFPSPVQLWHFDTFSWVLHLNSFLIFFPSLSDPHLAFSLRLDSRSSLKFVSRANSPKLREPSPPAPPRVIEGKEFSPGSNYCFSSQPLIWCFVTLDTSFLFLGLNFLFCDRGEKALLYLDHWDHCTSRSWEQRWGW